MQYSRQYSLFRIPIPVFGDNIHYFVFLFRYSVFVRIQWYCITCISCITLLLVFVYSVFGRMLLYEYSGIRQNSTRRAYVQFFFLSKVWTFFFFFFFVVRILSGSADRAERPNLLVAFFFFFFKINFPPEGSPKKFFSGRHVSTAPSAELDLIIYLFESEKIQLGHAGIIIPRHGCFSMDCWSLFYYASLV